MDLPHQPNLPVHHLAACFTETSATYKFYWFLSLLQAIEEGQTTIAKQQLFARMIANVWYTVNYFKVSFGKQDKLQETTLAMKEREGLPIDAAPATILSSLIHSLKQDTRNGLYYFDKQVPHWFLSPWLPQLDKTGIYEASKTFINNCLYALYKEEIVVNPAWVTYLQHNSGILKAFTYWKLALFLQAKNPNVPDIPNKLIKVAVRKDLTKQRKEYWDVVFAELKIIPCIYTNEPLTIGHYAVEHFIPYNFVSHDLIWNLIPADPIFNSTKSDKLPPFDKYFDDFFSLQRQAIHIVSQQKPACKWLEDYLTIWPQFSPAVQPDEAALKEKFRETIKPLLTIAANNGFQYLP
jgi:5-methylcytosine-specific restriction endonuclease McrA